MNVGIKLHHCSRILPAVLSLPKASRAVSSCNPQLFSCSAEEKSSSAKTKTRTRGATHFSSKEGKATGASFKEQNLSSMEGSQAEESLENSCPPLSTDDNDAQELHQSRALAQYVVIRKDLVDSLKWPLGSVLAQSCHAAVAAIWLFKEDPDTVSYCTDLDNMTTVTLEVKGETQLTNLSQKLEAEGIMHKLWIEQPENFPTCLATKPYPKSKVAHYFKKFKLCK